MSSNCDSCFSLKLVGPTEQRLHFFADMRCLLVLLGAAGALGQEFTGGPSGDKLEQEGDEVQVKASNFNDTRVQDLLTPNNLDPL